MSRLKKKEYEQFETHGNINLTVDSKRIMDWFIMDSSKFCCQFTKKITLKNNK